MDRKYDARDPTEGFVWWMIERFNLFQSLFGKGNLDFAKFIM